MHTIARDPESGAFVLTIDGCTHRLDAIQFDALSRQVLRLVQIHLTDAAFRLERAAAALVPCGVMPTREQFTLSFLTLYPHGVYSCHGHHAIPDGHHSEADLWRILEEQYRAMLSELATGSEASDARETVALILESVGLTWAHFPRI